MGLDEVPVREHVVVDEHDELGVAGGDTGVASGRRPGRRVEADDRDVETGSGVVADALDERRVAAVVDDDDAEAVDGLVAQARQGSDAARRRGCGS